MGADNQYHVPAVERTLGILETLAASPDGLGVSALSARTGLPKSSIFAIAGTLRDLGYVSCDPQSKSYRLTGMVLALASRVRPQADLRRLADPIMRRLVQTTGETVNLAALPDNGRPAYVETMEGPGPLKIATEISAPLYWHCTALGKVLLAWMPESDAERLAREQGFARRTANTIGDWEALRTQLRQVRERGYSTDDEEDVIGMRCLGTPVRDHRGRVMAGLSLTFPTSRADPGRLAHWTERLVAAAAELSGLLGYAGAGEEETHLG